MNLIGVRGVLILVKYGLGTRVNCERVLDYLSLCHVLKQSPYLESFTGNKQ